MSPRNIASISISALLTVATIITPAFADDSDASMSSPAGATVATDSPAGASIASDTSAGSSAATDTSKGVSCKAGHHCGGKGRMGRARRHMGGQIHKIRNLSSLTPDQSKKIDGILAQLKEDVKPLKEQAKSEKGKLMDIRKSVKAKVEDAKSKIKSVLTDEQLKELDAPTAPKADNVKS
jgi:hypothetical protein